MAYKARKRKVKKNVPEGQAHIHVTYNNTIITITDMDGNTVSWASAGTIGYKGSKKKTPFAAGMAAGGLKPFVCVYSSFLQRAYDEILHDVCIQSLPVIFCLDRAGLVGEDGATHQGVFDMAAFRSIPNLAIASPLNETELRNLLYSATCSDYPAIMIRYPRGSGEGADWRGKAFEKTELGRASVLSQGRSVALLSIGPIGNLCTKAVNEAKTRLGAEIMHIDMRFLKPLDTEAIEKACAAAQTLITVEDGTVIGGLHGAVSEYVSHKHPGIRVEAIGVPDRFIEQASVAEQYAECSMGWENILEKVEDFFGN